MAESTRRTFLKRSAAWAGAGSLSAALPESIARAAAIDPEPGSSYLDAEHVVILMQENRSFDHSFGMLRGVRGFNDPRAIELPDGNPVWVQTNDHGESFGPFRLDIQATNATWMGSLPHSWTNQVDARNGGRYDRWLQAKASGEPAYADMPLTMGYYTRDDIPFYYELADAFTICDQHFCSSLTGTNPNRLYLWTGTIRENPTADSPALVLNSDVDSGLSWTTFPERLQDHGISWKVYQNELTLDSGFTAEEDAWLANFADNPLEWFTQYQVRFAAGQRQHLARLAERLPSEVADLQRQSAEAQSPDARAAIDATLKDRAKLLAEVKEGLAQWNPENFAQLSARERDLHQHAFSTNIGDPHFRELTTLHYREGEDQREVLAPKGDILHQFRQDVERGELPMVSWLVPPEKLSDHPSSAWFGSWYLAEVLNILTKNPEVWKRTIFLLTYDENDGYFDHVPPFAAPDPHRPETGRVSESIDASVEYVTLDQDRQRRPASEARDSSIGLGYRVPLIIASPWSRGGCVCSQVFDHTSPLQFLEKLLSHKLERNIEESNISQWRRAVCGDLTAAFQPFTGEAAALSTLERDSFIEQIDRARYQPPPADFVRLDAAQLAELRRMPRNSPLLPTQEPGTRRSAPLPYELVVDGTKSRDGREFVLSFAALKEKFGERSAGAPFVAYARIGNDLQVRNYAVAPGERVEDSWDLSDSREGQYCIAVYGPNGYFREFFGGADEPAVSMCVRERRAGEGRALGAAVDLAFISDSRREVTVQIVDESYHAPPIERKLVPGGRVLCPIELQRSFGWYDLRIAIAGHDGFARRFAGRVETGAWGYSDSAMGGVAVIKPCAKSPANCAFP